MRLRWDELPDEVRSFMETAVGGVARAEEVTTGRSSDVAAVLQLRSGKKAFLKGVRGIGPRMRWLRNEITVGEMATGFAPGVLAHADVGEWLVVVFEFARGRPADLRPGSPDLAIVRSTVEKLSQAAAPGVGRLRDRWRVTDSWAKAAQRDPESTRGWDVTEMLRLASFAPEHVDGDRLLHTDLHGDQFIVGGAGTARVVDWGFPAAGAPWVDAAFLGIRLVEAGHEPREARMWARSLRGMADVEDEAVLSFAAYVSGLWTYWAVTERSDGAERRARAARAFAAHALRWC